MKNNCMIYISMISLLMVGCKFIKHQTRLSKYKSGNDDKSKSKAQQMYAYIDEKLEQVGQYFMNLNNVVDKIARQNIIQGIEKYLDIINQQRGLLIQDNIIDQSQLTRVDQQINQFQSELRNIKQQQIQLDHHQMQQQSQTQIDYNVHQSSTNPSYQSYSIPSGNIKVMRPYHNPINHFGLQNVDSSVQQYYEQPVIHIHHEQQPSPLIQIHHEVQMQPQQEVQLVHNSVDQSINDIQKQLKEQNQNQRDMMSILKLIKDKTERVEENQYKSDRVSHNIEQQEQLKEDEDRLNNKQQDMTNQIINDEEEDEKQMNDSHDEYSLDQVDHVVSNQNKDDLDHKMKAIDDIMESNKDKQIDQSHMIEYNQIHSNGKGQDQKVDQILQSLDNDVVIQKLKQKLQLSSGSNNMIRQNQSRRIKKKKG